jgi:ketosteroid isomerase-like protein
MAALALTGVSGVARADDATVKKELNALFGKFAAAFKKKDVKTAMSFFAPDYTATEGGRTLTRAQVEAQTTEAMARLKSVDALAWDIQKLTTKGNEATTEALETMSATILDSQGQMGPKGETHKIKDVERTRDRFVKSPKGWLLKHSETLSAEITIDGKKVPIPGGK